MSFLRRQLDAPKKLDKTIFGLNRGGSSDFKDFLPGAKIHPLGTGDEIDGSILDQ